MTIGRTGQEPGESENESMANEKERVKEGVRLVRWRMAHENTRFADEFRIIPRSLKIVAIALFIVGQVVAQVAYIFADKGDPMIAYVGGAAAASLIIGILLMLFGYVNRDAKRRGMNPTLWTLLAIFVPYGIGLVIYFAFGYRFSVMRGVEMMAKAGPALAETHPPASPSAGETGIKE